MLNTNTKSIEVPPVLSVHSAQGGRVTGKTAKERPRKHRNKRDFDYFLRRAANDSQFGEERGHVDSESVDTLA